MLSTDKACLAETGYQPKLHKFYCIATGTPLIFLLSKTICQAELFAFNNSFMTLGPGNPAVT